jgi:hypothetical protein
MTQTCSDPYTCIVTTSSFGPITAGTALNYTPDSPESCLTITVPDGSTTGACDLDRPAPVVGRFTFEGGTGVFDRFNLVADATVADETYPGAVWTWTGTYSFGDASGARGNLGTWHSPVSGATRSRAASDTSY